MQYASRSIATFIRYYSNKAIVGLLFLSACSHNASSHGVVIPTQAASCFVPVLPIQISPPLTHVSGIDADEASVCSRQPGGDVLFCWGRVRGVSLNIALNASGPRHRDRWWLWDHNSETFQRAQPRQSFVGAQQLQDEMTFPPRDRQPRAYRCGWEDCGIDQTGYRLSSFGEETLVVQPRQGALVLTAIVRADTLICVLDERKQLHCGRQPDDLRDPIPVMLQAPAAESSVEMLSATDSQICMQMSNRTLRCIFDDGADSALVRSRLVCENVEQFATANRSLCVRKTDGSVLCGTTPVDAATELALRPVELPEPAVQLVAGEAHFCARLSNATVWCWGEASFGRLGTYMAPLTPNLVELSEPVTSAVAGWGHSCALTRSGNVYCWGLAYQGQTADVAAVQPRARASVDRFRTTPLPLRVPLERVPTELRGFGMGTCVITDGVWTCWGSNLRGFFSPPVNFEVVVPAVAVPTVITSVPSSLRDGSYRAPVGDHACELRADRRVYCRGDNRHGQLGRPGLGSDQWSVVPGLADIVGVTNGAAHSCAWNRCGQLFCWGSNDYLQRSMPSRLNPSVPHPVVREAVSLEPTPTPSAPAAASH